MSDDATTPRTLGRRVVAGLKWGAAARVVQLGVQLASNAALARLLDRDAFGLVNMSAIFLAVANAFADFGIRSFIVQNREIDAREYRAAQLASWMLGGAVFATGLVAAFPLAAFYREPRLAPLLAVQSSLYLVANAGSVFTARISRALAFEKLARIEVVVSVATLVGTVGLALAGAGYWSLVLGRLFSALVGLALVTPSVRELLPRPDAWRDLRPVLGFGSRMVVASAMTQLDENLDNIVVGRTMGAHVLGLYAVAYNLAALPQRYVAFLIAGVAQPAVARATDGDELRRAAVRFVRFQTLVPGALSAAFGVFAPEVCRILLGPRWSAAPPFVQVMSVSSGVLGVGTAIGGLLVTRGQSPALVRFTFYKLVLMALGVGFGLRGGALGVAIGFAVASTVSVLYGLGLTGARLGLGWLVLPRSLVAPACVVALAASVTTVLARALRTYAHAPWLPLSGAGLAGLFVLLVATRIACPGEWADLREHLPRRARD